MKCYDHLNIKCCLLPHIYFRASCQRLLVYRNHQSGRRKCTMNCRPTECQGNTAQYRLRAFTTHFPSTKIVDLRYIHLSAFANRKKL